MLIRTLASVMTLLAKKFVRVFHSMLWKNPNELFGQTNISRMVIFNASLMNYCNSFSQFFSQLHLCPTSIYLADYNSSHFPKCFDTFLSKNIYSLYHHLLNIPKLSGIQGLPQSIHKPSSLPLFLSSCLFGLLPSHSFLINK